MARRLTWAYALGPAALAEVEQAARSPLAAGRCIPGTRLRLRRQVAVGPRTVAYEAEHLHLERDVEVEVVRADLDEIETENRRLLDAARRIAGIDSPHVSAVLDFGFLGDGRAYAVTELARGRVLADEIARGSMSRERAVRLLRQIRAAVAAAQQRGVACDLRADRIVVVACVGAAERALLRGTAAAPSRADRTELGRLAMALLDGAPVGDAASSDVWQWADERAETSSVGEAPQRPWRRSVRVAVPIAFAVAITGIWVDSSFLSRPAPPAREFATAPAEPDTPATAVNPPPPPALATTVEAEPPQPPMPTSALTTTPVETPRTVAAPTPAPTPASAPAPARTDPLRAARVNDRSAAQEAARRGASALAAGDRAAAASAFRTALQQDPKNAAALAGASDIAFDEGDYGRALQMARRAAKAQPRDARHVLRVGDAAFKLRDYATAAASYRRAAELGHPEAAARLQRLPSG